MCYQSRSTHGQVDRRNACLKDLLKAELQYVQKESHRAHTNLESVTDAQFGLEALHLFILDLLERDTPVAKIFLSKSENDFRHANVCQETRHDCRLDSSDAYECAVCLKASAVRRQGLTRMIAIVWLS